MPQILTIWPSTETRCKYAQHSQIQKPAANTNNTTKYRNALQIRTTQPNTETCCKYAQTTSEMFKVTTTSDEPGWDMLMHVYSERWDFRLLATVRQPCFLKIFPYRAMWWLHTFVVLETWKLASPWFHRQKNNRILFFHLLLDYSRK